MGENMDFKKILAISLVLLTLCVSIGAVCALDLGLINSNPKPINIGDITKENIDITNIDNANSKLEFTADIEVDISELSADEKTLLEKAINDESTSFTLNLTSGKAIKISIWSSKGPDEVSISGDTLYVKDDQEYSMVGALDLNDLDITSITFNTTSGQVFLAEDIIANK